jgi:hypothetical protein
MAKPTSIAIVNPGPEGKPLSTYKRAIERIACGLAEWVIPRRSIRLLTANPTPAALPNNPVADRPRDGGEIPGWTACWLNTQAAVAWPWQADDGTVV